MAQKSKKGPLITHKSYLSVELEAQKRLHALSTLNHTAILSATRGANPDLSFTRPSHRALNHSAMQPTSNNSHLILDESKLRKEALLLTSDISSEPEEDPEVLFESMRINGQNGLIEYGKIQFDGLQKGRLMLGLWLGIKVAVKSFQFLKDLKTRNTEIIQAMLRELNKMQNLRHPNLVLNLGISLETRGRDLHLY